MEFTVEFRAGTEVSFNLLAPPPPLSGDTNDSPSLFAPDEYGPDKGGDAVEVKVTKEANTKRESMARNSFRSSMFNRRNAHEEQVI